jgi:LytS/YehU family sensor histidine kinase
VRHGLDPSEDGGRIDVGIARRGERCVIRVVDSGAGLHHAAEGLGTGLTTLRERLHLIFGDAATMRLMPNPPRGTVAEIDMPALT